MIEDKRVWDGDNPPGDLHEVALIGGVFVKPWAVPIEVVNAPAVDRRTVVSKQGLDGTTSKYAIGEGSRLSPDGSTAFVDPNGEPMAGDPVSHELRLAQPPRNPGL